VATSRDLKVATPEEVRKAMGEAQKEMANMPRGRTLLMQMKPDNMIKFVAIPLAGA